jgi:hypothetical protein
MQAGAHMAAQCGMPASPNVAAAKMTVKFIV